MLLWSIASWILFLAVLHCAIVLCRSPSSSMPGALVSSRNLLTTISALVPLAFPLYLMSRMNQRIRYIVRFTLYCTTLGLTSVWAIILSLALNLVGQPSSIQHWVARSFYYFASPVLGWKLRIEGQEHLSDEGCTVLVGNHQS